MGALVMGAVAMCAMAMGTAEVDVAVADAMTPVWRAFYSLLFSTCCSCFSVCVWLLCCCTRCGCCAAAGGSRQHFGARAWSTTK